MPRWPHFIRTLLFGSLILALVIYAFILILDPYQNVPVSPPLARAPVSTNQRFAYPAVARNPDFDSVIIGTSTSRLLDPERLNVLLDARFANLAMNSATANEQWQLMDLFARHHAHIANLIVGVDETWCNRREHIDDYTFREFPHWMFDDNRWNDLLYLFNDKALENAVRMLELLTGRREPKYRNDGYRDFTLDFHGRDERALQARLYGGAGHDYALAEVHPSRLHPDWHYALLPQLLALVKRAGDAHVVLLFPPLHARYVANIAENMSECKARIVEALAALPAVATVDYLFASPLTSNDDHYWDPIHTTSAVARLLEVDLARALRGETPISPYARTLTAELRRAPQP